MKQSTDSNTAKTSQNQTKSTPKRKFVPVSKKITHAMIITMTISYALLMLAVTYFAGKSLQQMENKYLLEVSSNIANEVEQSVAQYEIATEVLANISTTIALLETSNSALPMHQNEIGFAVVADMKRIADEYPNVVINISVMDIEQDGYLLHTGAASDSSFSFKTRSYYEVVNTKRTMLTEPYVDTVTGNMVISIASPVISDSGVALGAVVLDIDVSFIRDLVVSSAFGGSGSSLILDQNNIILGHANSAMVGHPYTDLKLTGTDLVRELSNPTGAFVSYDSGGVDRVGTVANIMDADWKIVIGIDKSEYDENIVNMLWIILAFMVATGCAVSLVTALTAKKQMAPLEQISEAMDHLAKGELHYELTYQANDEIGKVADNMRAMSHALSDYIDEIGRQLKHFGEGDFDVEPAIEFKGDFVGLQAAMQNFIHLISGTLISLKNIIEQVNIGSAQVASGSQILADGSISQTQNIQSLNDYIQHIAQTIESNADTATEANTSAIEIGQSLEGSNQQMKEMVASMEDIHEKSEQINEIVSTIESIAFRTNILALNAAVEAARAGESGRGFAVVADEVRNLAQQTTEAVGRTAELIEGTTTSVANGVTLVTGTAEKLQEVTDGVERFIKMINEISNASKQQSDDIVEIKSGITQITSVTHSNSAISEESAASSEELSGQAHIMQETVEQFKTRKIYTNHP